MGVVKKPLKKQGNPGQPPTQTPSLSSLQTGSAMSSHVEPCRAARPRTCDDLRRVKTSSKNQLCLEYLGINILLSPVRTEKKCELNTFQSQGVLYVFLLRSTKSTATVSSLVDQDGLAPGSWLRVRSQHRSQSAPRRGDQSVPTTGEGPEDCWLA